MFRIELVWTDDDLPEGSPDVLGDLNVPALPPMETLIRLRNPEAGTYFAVYVDGYILLADNPGTTNYYVVEVSPAD